MKGRAFQCAYCSLSSIFGGSSGSKGGGGGRGGRCPEALIFFSAEPGAP